LPFLKVASRLRLLFARRFVVRIHYTNWRPAKWAL
jgi:hypothetical protein